MAPESEQDWDPGTYARFRDLRLRPALDLLAHLPELPDGDVIDLGCGNGVVATDLRMRFAPKGHRTLTGVDLSRTMLEEAEILGLYDRLIEADIVAWSPDTPPALIFSNAALHWLPDHATLLPRLARSLGPGGTLAVQMPRQFEGASHQLLREISSRLFPDRFDWTGWTPPVAPPATYHRILAPFGRLTLWETEYFQILDPAEDGHPVRRFTQSTALRPVAAKLSDPELERFLAAYDTALAEDYPAGENGRVLFPFRRLFFVLTV